MSDISELRLTMQAAGFDPIPVIGKDARLKGWNAKHSAEEIAAWAARYPRWSNTGMRTCNTPTMDLDIMHPEAASAVGKWCGTDSTAAARSWFGSAWRPSVRYRFELARRSRR